MEPIAIIEVGREAILLLLKTALPLLLVALAVGFLISLLQALTQIQEPTLSFVPKIIAIFVTLLIALPFMGTAFGSFADEIMSLIVNIN